MATWFLVPRTAMISSASANELLATEFIESYLLTEQGLETVNADVPQLKVRFLEERDHAANPLLAKGIGELGISGAGAAVANAIYNACGVRVRDYPITLDKLIAHLPDPATVRRSA